VGNYSVAVSPADGSIWGSFVPTRRSRNITRCPITTRTSPLRRTRYAGRTSTAMG
jgi:hypothetical protein